MKRSDGQTKSLWKDGVEVPIYRGVSKDKLADAALRSISKDDEHGIREGKYEHAFAVHRSSNARWNHVEYSWDCPCHGSRFDPFGKVLIGPAVDDLPIVP